MCVSVNETHANPRRVFDIIYILVYSSLLLLTKIIIIIYYNIMVQSIRVVHEYDAYTVMEDKTNVTRMFSIIREITY